MLQMYLTIKKKALDDFYFSYIYIYFFAFFLEGGGRGWGRGEVEKTDILQIDIYCSCI